MNKQILIADDNEGIVDILKKYVSKEGFSPVIADNGESSIDIRVSYWGSI